MNVKKIEMETITLEIKRTYSSRIHERKEYEIMELSIPHYNDGYTANAYVVVCDGTHKLKLSYSEFLRLCSPNYPKISQFNWVTNSVRSVYRVLKITDTHVTVEETGFDCSLYTFTIKEFLAGFHKSAIESIKDAKMYNKRNSTYEEKHKRNLELLGVQDG